MIQKSTLLKILLFYICATLIFSFHPTLCDDIDYESENLDILAEIKNNNTINTSNNINNNLQLNSRSCIVLDRISKQTLYGKNEKNKVKMASTTKIMTAIIVLENSTLNNVVEVSKKAANTVGSRLGLKTGDKITIRDLLYGLLLCSGNDASVSLAENIAGSVENFVNLMNKKCEELKLYNTHFESPHGLDSENHYTTAYELAILADYALNNSTFKNIVGTKQYTVTINGYPKAISNTNELLGNLDGVYGIKTGFTNGANRCLVTSYKRGKMDIICVVLGADTKNFRTKDSIKLIEYAFKNFEYFNLKDFVNNYLDNWKKDNPNFFFVEKGLSNTVTIKIDSSIENMTIIPIRKDLIPYIQADISMNNYLIAPIKKDDLIGCLNVFSGNNSIAIFNLLSDSNIQKNNISDYLFRFFKDFSSIISSCK